MPESRSVRAELVRREQFRREALFPEQFAHQPECRQLVAPALNQHVENLALVIDGAPQIHPFAGNPDHHLVEVPSPVDRQTTASKPCASPVRSIANGSSPPRADLPSERREGRKWGPRLCEKGR